MSYDYFSNPIYYLIGINDFYKDIKEIISPLWNKIKADRKIKWAKKAEALLKDFEKEFRSMIRKNLEEYQLFPISYLKVAKVFEFIYSSERFHKLLYDILKNDLHNKDETKKIIDKFNVDEILTQEYKRIFQNINKNWLRTSNEIRGEITDLKLDPHEIKIEDIRAICYNSLENNVIFIKINFTLKTPLISKDEDGFYFIDNPICKDNVFKVPYVRPGSWKGKLRWVATYNLLERLDKRNFNNWESERCKLVRLFGNEKDIISSWLDDQIAKGLGKKSEEISKQFLSFLKDQHYISKDDKRRGRLIFYPTFLDKYGLDVIAPHKRDSRTISEKTGPIYIETAPEGSEGTFAVLYFPFDYLVRENIHSEVMEDLEILKESIPDMLTKYGFGAKTTAGFGIVRNSITFQLFPFSNEIFKDDNFGKSEVSKFIDKIDNLKEGGTN